MAETSDIRKPLCVAVVEGCLWAVALGMAALSFVMAARHGMPDRDDLLAAASLFAASLLPAGMALAIRRGRRGWFEGPFVLVMGLLIAPCLSAVLSSQGYGGWVPWSYPAVLVQTALVPIVLLRLPSSSRWFAFKSGGRKSRFGCGCLVAAVLAFVYLQLFFFFMSEDPRRRANAARLWSLSMQGRNIYLLQKRNAEARAAGGDWVDPTSCSNAVDYVSRLVARFDEGIFGDRPPAPVWQIAVNPGEDADLPDAFPLMVTANFDLSRIPQAWLGANDSGQVSLVLHRIEGSGDQYGRSDLASVLGDKAAIVIRRGGAAQIVKAKFLRPRFVFGTEPWSLPAGMFWLTPTGRSGPQHSGD